MGWQDEKACQEYLKVWVTERKLLMRVEDLNPGTWFKEQWHAWNRLLEDWRKRQQAWKDPAMRREAERKRREREDWEKRKAKDKDGEREAKEDKEDKEEKDVVDLDAKENKEEKEEKGC